MHKILLTGITLFCLHASYAQSVGINKDGTSPDASAMLDVKNPNKGLLVPRVTLTGTDDAATIPSPATSLLVYNTTANGAGGTAVTPGYYYWSGTAWLMLSTGSGAATSWLQTGNAGTVDATSFIGTTDNIPFNVRVNNQKAGRIDNTLENTFWGYQAGNSNTFGGANTANGSYALYSNTTGNTNTANGYAVLYSNTTGNNNTANGYAALYSNTTGSHNTASGRNALYSNTVGDFNTANGRFALYSNTTGRFNTANGNQALFTNTTGSNNTALGYEANVGSGALTNATALGNGAIVDASNKVRIGNFAVTVIEGQVAFSSPSDARFKYDIQNNVPGLEFIKKLTPVTYYFDEDKLAEYTKTGIINNSIAHSASYNGEKQLHTGFLAQDVEKIANQLGYSFDGVHAPENDKDHYSLAYSQFIMPLVKSVQEQHQIIETQKNDIEILKAQVAELAKAVNTLTRK